MTIYEEYTVNLLNSNDAIIRELTNVDSLNLDWSVFRDIPSTGDITLQNPEPDIDWLNHRIGVVYTAINDDPNNGLPVGTEYSLPIGVYIPSISNEERIGTSNVTKPIQLLDKCELLNRTSIIESKSYPAGYNVISAVEEVISMVGESPASITPSDSVLRTAISWRAGTSLLDIVNSLLSSVNYARLWVDGSGQFRAQPYIPPDRRPTMWQFKGGDGSLMDPVRQIEQDLNIPNRVIVRTEATEDVEALVGVATNENPDSPYSYQSRGNLWIDRVEDASNEVDQDTVDNKAQRILDESYQVLIKANIQHAVIPLSMNDVAIMYDGRRMAVVQRTLECSPGNLVTSTFREFETLR